MILPVHDVLTSHLRAALTQQYGLAREDQPAIVISTPPARAMGDLAVPVAFELARRLRKAPRAIAQEIATTIGIPPGFTRVEATPQGYLHFFLDRPAALASWLAPGPCKENTTSR